MWSPSDVDFLFGYVVTRFIYSAQGSILQGAVIDPVVNHDRSMREAGQRVQPNLSRHTVASIVCTFGNDNDTLLVFAVNLLYCVSLYLHSWQQPFLYFCKVCCHNTM